MAPVEFNNEYKIEHLKSLNLNEIFLQPLKQLMQDKTKNLFRSVQSIKALGNIRAAVWESVANGIKKNIFYVNDGNSTESNLDNPNDNIPEWALGLDDMQNLQKPTCLTVWLKLVKYLFTEDHWSEKQDIWLLFFNENFNLRVYEIIELNYKNVYEETKTRLDQFVNGASSSSDEGDNPEILSNLATDLEKNENLEDLSIFSTQLENNRWIFTENDLNSTSKNFDIVMKSQGFTPEVQLLCKYINKAVQKMSTDIYYCLDQLDNYPGSSLEIRLLNRFKSLSSNQTTDLNQKIKVRTE